MPKAQRSQASEAMEGTTAVKQPFDFEKYRINTAPVVKTLTVDDEEFEVTVKPLTWSKKNQFLSKCLKWDTDGNTVFDGDAYVRECLKEILVNAPWGKTTEIFLISIDERLGNALEQLVPSAFGTGLGSDVENLNGG